MSFFYLQHCSFWYRMLTLSDYHALSFVGFWAPGVPTTYVPLMCLVYNSSIVHAARWSISFDFLLLIRMLHLHDSCLMYSIAKNTSVPRLCWHDRKPWRREIEKRQNKWPRNHGTPHSVASVVFFAERNFRSCQCVAIHARQKDSRLKKDRKRQRRKGKRKQNQIQNAKKEAIQTSHNPPAKGAQRSTSIDLAHRKNTRK